MQSHLDTGKTLSEKIGKGYRKFLRYWSTNSLLQIILTRRLSNILKSPIELLSEESPTETTRLVPPKSSHVQYTDDRESEGEEITLLESSDTGSSTDSKKTPLSKNFKKLERRLRFLEGTRVFTEKLWPATFTALMLTDLIEYTADPSARYDNHLWKIFAGIARDSQILSSYLGMELPPRVSYSLPLAALPLIPLSFGAMQLLLTVLYTRNNTLEGLEQALKEINEQSIFWSLNTALNPFSRSHHTLLRAEFALSRTVHLKDDQQNIVKAFEDLAEKHRRLTGWIANRALIEARANRCVEVDVTMPSFIRTPSHHIYFNYQLWSQGQKPKLWADVLFPVLSLYWLYTQLRLLQLLGLKIYDAAEFIKNEIACTKDNRLFKFLEAYGDYLCAMCDYEGMLDVDKLDTQRCLDFLLTTQHPDPILSDLDRLLKTDRVGRFDFSKQNLRNWDEVKFDTLLQKFAKQVQLETVIFSAPNALPVFPSDNRFIALQRFLFNRTLTRLSFANQGMGDANLMRLLNTTLQVENLDLSGNYLSVQSANFLGQRLKPFNTSTLILGENPLQDEGILSLARHIGNLTTLDLSQTQMTQTGFLAVLSSHNRTPLTQFLVNNNPLIFTNMTQVGQVIMQSDLQHLSMAGIGLADTTLSELVPYLVNGTLVELNVGHNDIQDVGFLTLLDLSRNSTLKFIVFDNNAISSFGLTKAAGLLPTLTVDTLSLNHLLGDQSGWEAFFLNLNLSILKQLFVRQNDLNNALIQGYANHTRFLTTLDLSDNALTDPCATSLAQTLPGSMLQVLVLSENNLTDTTLIQLALHLPGSKLEQLIIESAAIGDAGIHRLGDILSHTFLRVLGFKNNQISDNAASFFIRKTIKEVPNESKLGKDYNRFQSRYLIKHGKPASTLQELDFRDNPTGTDSCDTFNLVAPANGVNFFATPGCSQGSATNWTALAAGATALSGQLGGIMLSASPRIGSDNSDIHHLSESSNSQINLSAAIAVGTLAIAMVIILLTLLYRMTHSNNTQATRRHFNA